MTATPLTYGAGVQNTESYVRTPKQNRSRKSFDKAVDAAVALFVERGSDAFTLADVASRSGVSTGSIYTRVDSKDDLLRAAHAREMARFAEQTREAFSTDIPDDESFADTIARVIRQLAGLLRDNAPVLAAFMRRAGQDPVIAENGKTTHAEAVKCFREALLARREDIRHPDPDHSVTWSFTVAYSVLARWLGLGTEPTAAGEGDWDVILTDLTEMITTFLANPGRTTR
jgi:AcrR family transcriptional regulator